MKSVDDDDNDDDDDDDDDDFPLSSKTNIWFIWFDLCCVKLIWFDLLWFKKRIYPR